MNEMHLLEDLCAAVPPPDPQRHAATRARVLSAITEGRVRAGRGPRGPWPAAFSVPRRRWLGWVAPLAAAAAVAGVIVGTQTLFTAAPQGQPPGSVFRPVTAYVASGAGTVTPIRGR